MKKKLIITVIIAIAILIIGGCMANSASASEIRRTHNCVTKKEWKTKGWDATPKELAHHFHAKGAVMQLSTSTHTVNETGDTPTYINAIDTMTKTVIYSKCGRYVRNPWGKGELVTVTFYGYWDHNAYPDPDNIIRMVDAQS